MSAYSSMNSHVNHGFYFFEAKMSFLIPLNFGYRALKLVGRNSDTYKPTVEGNLSAPLSNASAKREALPLATQHHTCMKKTA